MRIWIAFALASTALADEGLLERLRSVAARLGATVERFAPPPGPGREREGFVVELPNADSRGRPVLRFDETGSALDAHDGKIVRFGDTFYLYGTSYDCGHGWRTPGTRFCGFKVYSSPDLLHWRDRGFLFDASGADWQRRCDGGTLGCFRPKVVFNARAKLYLLWINAADGGTGYHVFESTSPVGPFLERARPRLSANSDAPPGLSNGDHDVFVDRDGSAYLAFTDWIAGGDIVIERLDEAYGSGAGRATRLGLRNVEAPALFERGGVYYLLVSDPNCGYCAAGMAYFTAPEPLGPWTRRGNVSGDSCGGQPEAVALVDGPQGPQYLFQSDLWQEKRRFWRWGLPNPNQALALSYWGRLDFRADGSLGPLRCEKTERLELSGTPPALPLGERGFRPWCDVGAKLGSVLRRQTFTLERSGTLAELGLALFQYDGPDAPLTLELDGGQRSPVLFRESVWPGFAPRNVVFRPGVVVEAGRTYRITLSASLATGCYGVALSDESGEALGEHYYSGDGGASWKLERGRALKLHAVVR